MKMTNSPLVAYTQLSPNCSKPRNKPISKITIHHVAGNLSVEAIGNVFTPASRQASSNYGIDSDGRVGLYVEEKNRAWTSSNAANDNQAVTIEVSNSAIGGEWPVSDNAYATLIDLCTDICQRNDIEWLTYTGNPDGSLTHHQMFQVTSCPGPYLLKRFEEICQLVNARLKASRAQIKEGEEMTKEQFREMFNQEISIRAYKSLDDLPEWARPTVQKLISKGLIAGKGIDNLGISSLTEDLVKSLVINDRAGLYG